MGAPDDSYNKRIKLDDNTQARPGNKRSETSEEESEEGVKSSYIGENRREKATTSAAASNKSKDEENSEDISECDENDESQKNSTRTSNKADDKLYTKFKSFFASQLAKIVPARLQHLNFKELRSDPKCKEAGIPGELAKLEGRMFLIVKLVIYLHTNNIKKILKIN